MSTRLDRLFLLLENGSTAVIRKSAAEQLGQVQKLHPHELNNLLDKVHVYLCSNNWDTRIAAGQAVQSIIKHVPKWHPPSVPKEEFAITDSSGSHLLGFDSFQISTVLHHGASLLASEGAEYDIQQDTQGMPVAERLALEKQRLNQRLGLDIAAQMGINSTDQLIKEEDLLHQHTETPNIQHSSVVELVAQHLSKAEHTNDTSLSARERNRAKRKAKQLAKQTSRDTDLRNAGTGSGSDSDAPACKQRRMSAVIVDQSKSRSSTPDYSEKMVIDTDSKWDSNEHCTWPFDSFCGMLVRDLFDSTWEKRHGGATGLRELIRLHGDGAGRGRGQTPEQMDAYNQRWLEDMALRLICVLALDRFGDFVSDEVVAPVRETCAQTLGTVIHHMTDDSMTACLKAILQLTAERQWEVRHGGLLAIKYLIAARQHLTRTLVPLVLPSLFQGLQDQDDDVRSVGASALIPLTATLNQYYANQIPAIVQCLWGTLADLDDLTSSTASIMTLLADLLSKPSANTQGSSVCLTEVVPLLWPFFRHHNSAVRKSALLTLKALTDQAKLQPEGATWMLPILQDAFRHIYQRALFEHKNSVFDVIEEVWSSLMACIPVSHIIGVVQPWLGVCLCLIMQAPHLPYESNMIIVAKHTQKELTPSRLRHAVNHNEQQIQQGSAASSTTKTLLGVSPLSMERKEYLGGAETLSESHPVRDLVIVRACLMACRLLGIMYHHITTPCNNNSSPPTPSSPQTSIDGVVAITPPVETTLGAIMYTLNVYLSSRSAIQRLYVANSVLEWADCQKPCMCPKDFCQQLVNALCESIYFDEIATTFSRMQTECKDFVAGLKQIGAKFDASFVDVPIYNLDVAHRLSHDIYDEVRKTLKAKQLQLYDERRKCLVNTITQAELQQHTHTRRVQSSLAGALIKLNHFPPKMNPLIRPLMESIKKEENAQLQHRAAVSLSHLLMLCCTREPNPTPKVIRNLCTSLCCDNEQTPRVEEVDVACASDKSNDSKALSDQTPLCDCYSGIILLNAQNKYTPVRPGRKSTVKRPQQTTVIGGVEIAATLKLEDEEKRSIFYQRRGATFALTSIVKLCGADLMTTIPALWDNVNVISKHKDVLDAPTGPDAFQTYQELVNALQVMEVITPVIHPNLRNQIFSHISTLCHLVKHRYTAVRHMASRCITMLASIRPVYCMEYIFSDVKPLLTNMELSHWRQGAIETLQFLVDDLGLSIVPYIVLLLVPVLGRISDQDTSVRLQAAQCFAALVKLAPLDGKRAESKSDVKEESSGIEHKSESPENGFTDSGDLPAMSKYLSVRKEEEREFLDQLMDIKRLQNYKIPIPIDATLRTYQQAGVNWLAFLSRYKLHGILCDDMGLGKTLQSICMIAGDHHYSRMYRDKEAGRTHSLVVCPPTLTGHWVYEINKFVEEKYLKPLHYTGTPFERARSQDLLSDHDVVVTSYDAVRNDISFFSKIPWNYCVLDEGHIIKNSKTKLSQAVKRLSCQHRIILSGTPIQNNVLELWSLFDFLMPGYLGTERQFQQRYGRPILQSRDAKSSSKDQEAGALAMESLHRQVLPFLLRRKKEDVLKDLPPKIMQDYYCDLSPLQVELYEDFSRSQAAQGVEDSLGDRAGKADKTRGTHVFQALQYLRKVCNHPLLVLNPQHPKYEEVNAKLKHHGSNLADLHHATKLTALKQLLLDCGIGCDNSEEAVVNQHRVLLFCQLKSMLDIVEKHLLQAQMPSVTYLRLDGSVPAGSRHNLVTRFNADPSIDVLLLTTHVGGLGLNLTGADTVIFVEHDWNPMKDLQAMDRAHRIGQKKVVTVYRLITRGTLEEKIMSLQRFKLHLANTVISDENSSLSGMGTESLLDLFTISSPTKDDKQALNLNPDVQGLGQGAKEVLGGLTDLWDEKEYEEEYDLTNFMKTLQQ